MNKRKARYFVGISFHSLYQYTVFK